MSTSAKAMATKSAKYDDSVNRNKIFDQNGGNARTRNAGAAFPPFSFASHCGRTEAMARK